MYTFTAMKKFLLAIFAFLYMCTSIGATVEMHYCMGKLADWSIGHNTSETCSRCGMVKSVKKNTGCCKDEYRFIKNDTDQKKTESTPYQIQLIAIAFPAPIISAAYPVIIAVQKENIFCNRPPSSGAVAIYIRNCVFLI